MRYFSNLFWGALLLMLGIIALLWATDVIENIAFLKVWWPMFIIIPCAIRLMFAPDKIMSLLGLGIGVVLQLYRCGLIEDFKTTAAITGAVALIMIALQVLTRGGRMPRGGHR